MNLTNIANGRISNIKTVSMPSIKSGEPNPNQKIHTITIGRRTIKVFQSYDTTIAVKDEKGCVTLDEANWDISKTTSAYLNYFLNETLPERKKKVLAGEYKLAKLN